MIKLRDYQQETVDEVRSKIKESISKILVVSPVGSGKTVMFSYIAENAVRKYKRVLIISHRIELLAQAGGTLSEFNLTPQLITSKTKNPPKGSVFVAMTGTLKNRVSTKSEWKDWWGKIDIIIIDEAHRSEFYWISEYEEGKVKLGFTATAKRKGKMPQLISEYDTMVQRVDVQELINQGYLVYDRYYGVPVDISGVSKDANGEYNSNESYERFGKAEVYDGLIKNIRKYAANETSIVFCCNIKHTIETCVKLNEAGFSAKFVVSQPSKPQIPKTDNKAQLTLYKRKLDAYEFYKRHYDKFSGKREGIVESWKNGEFKYLCNAGIFVEGFDHKPTQAVILNLATTSDNKFMQMAGRGSRISDGKRYFKLLDFGANADRLGHYRAQREYSLIHKISKGDGLTGHKECPNCGALVTASSTICKYCGEEFKIVKKSRFVDLEERDYDSPFERIADDEDRSAQWVWRQIWIDGGNKALKLYGERVGYPENWVELAKNSNKPTADAVRSIIPQIRNDGAEEALKEYGKKKGYHKYWYKKQSDRMRG